MKTPLWLQLIMGGPDVKKVIVPCDKCGGTGTMYIADMLISCDHPDCNKGYITKYVKKQKEDK